MDLGETLRGDELRLASLLDALADAVTIRGLDGHIHYANRAALQTMGMSSIAEIRAADPRSLLERHALSDMEGRAVGLDDLPSMRLLRGEPAEPLALHSILHESGEERWIVMKTAPLRDESGAIVAAATIIEDITDISRAEVRFRFLARADRILSSSLDYEQTLRNVARLAVPEIADWCAVDLFSPQSDARDTVAIAHVDESKLELARQLRAHEPEELDPDAGLGLVRRTGKPLLYADIPDALLVDGARDAEHLRLLRQVGFRSALVVPMFVREEVIGALTLVNSESGRGMDERDLEFATQIADRAALAVENARLYSERSEIATTLQRRLRPEALPDVPGWELAAVYRPAGRENEVGGDFYDVWEIDGAWLMIIGDVEGKGAGAAGVTALARHTAWAVSRFDARPGAILRHVNEALLRRGGDEGCTALCMRVDGTHIVIAGGGHPLPVHITADGVQHVGRHGTMLGAFERLQIEERTLEIAPGEALVAFTDGLTDALGPDGERFEVRRVREALAGAHGESAAQVSTRLIAALDDFRDRPADDDVAVVAMRYTGR